MKPILNSKNIYQFRKLLLGYSLGEAVGNTVGFWAGLGTTYYAYTKKNTNDKSYPAWCASPFITTYLGTLAGHTKMTKHPVPSIVSKLFHHAPLRHFYLNIGLFAISSSKYFRTNENSGNKNLLSCQRTVRKCPEFN